MTDPISTAKAAVSIAGDVMKLASDTPEARAAGGEVAKAALTVTKTINNALLPLAAINFAFDKARDYFSTRFDDDLSEKLRNVPSERIIEPKASVAGPALQGLAFAHEEPEASSTSAGSRGASTGWPSSLAGRR